jgi:predicted outer membrane repeat protein
MRKKVLCYSGLGLALLLPCLTLPSRALACVVGTGGGTCDESALTACLPSGGSFDSTVTFNCGGAATITVTSTKDISADTTIDGGSLITISGGGSVGVFHVSSGLKFTVQNLTIANGHVATGVTGGGIASYGATLTVTNSTFSGNSAIGFGCNGGGIYALGGTVTVTNSTFSGNSTSGNGGGIYSDSTLTVTNSTFSGNSARTGSGIWNDATLTVTNSTFSGNGELGVFNNSGTLTVTNSTFSGNGAYGIFNNSGTLTVTNTIIANSSTSGGNCYGTITNGGHNIEDGTTCGWGSGSGSLSSTDPRLDPAGLANNGGPTQTFALCTGLGTPAACTVASPGINAGDESVCSTTTGTAPVDNLDQRGFVRPGSGATKCSIGAFEANSAAPRPPACMGDCNGNGQVTVDEILTMVNIALGNTVTACDAGDANHDGQITVDEILTAVNNALNGCGG